MPPQEHNFASNPKAKDGPSYQTLSPIQNVRIADEVFQRSLKTPYITISSEELLSLSPEVRNKLREQITPKQVQLPGDNAAALLHDNCIIVQDPYEAYIASLENGKNPEPIIAARESHSIRSVMIDFHKKGEVECVVDPGSSIIVMSEEVCHNLSLIYDPSVQLPMQCANGSIDKTLGLARNVPCEIGPITLYMQIHVVRDPAYDVLLGRPFDVLTASVVRNYRNESQTITISDPNSETSVTVPTIPRSNQ